MDSVSMLKEHISGEIKQFVSDIEQETGIPYKVLLLYINSKAPEMLKVGYVMGLLRALEYIE